MGAKRPRVRTYRTKVSGVTFDNERGRPRSRQRIIALYCQPGEELDLRPEPDNPHQADAMGLWVLSDGPIRRRWYQVGYIPRDDANMVRACLARGCLVKVRIAEVVGGWGDLNLGLRIDLTVIEAQPTENVPGHWEADEPGAEGMAESGVSKEALLAPVMAVTSFALTRLLPFPFAAWLIFLLAGRARDGLGITIVSVLLAAGFWGIRWTIGGKKSD